MPITRVKENDRATGLRGRRGRRADPILPHFIHGITVTGLCFLRIKCALYISPYFIHPPCTLVPPGSAIQEPLAESNLSAQGVTGTPSTGAEGLPYKFTPLLTSQETLLHLFSPGTALYCGPRPTIIADESSGSVSCPLDHSLHQCFEQHQRQ